MKKYKLIFLLLFIFSQASYSQMACDENLEKAKKLLFENSPFADGASIFGMINSCAQEGNVEAESLLGLLYLNGVGTEVNQDLAFQHVSNAANKGFATAQYNLGRMYKYGDGCALSYERAIEWFEKAAANGNQRASYSLGYMYFKGLAVAQDYSKAIHWFEQSEDHMAKHYLGLSYYLGYGVEANVDKALELLEDNPILNSKALLSYIQSNRKERIEAEVEQVLAANDTDSKEDLNLETTASKGTSTANTLEGVSKAELSGEWEGKFIQYDWSGKTIVRIIPIELSFNASGNGLSVSSSLERKGEQLKAVWQDNSIHFVDPFEFTLAKLFAHDIKNPTLDYRLLSLDVSQQMISDEPYLIADVETYIDERKEYGRPGRIVLKRSGTSDFDEDILETLAPQENQFNVYPVPFQNEITIQYELATESNVQVELLEVSGKQALILQAEVERERGEHEYTIQIDNNLPDGLYIVRLITENQSNSRLIIKQN